MAFYLVPQIEPRGRDKNKLKNKQKAPPASPETHDA